MKAGIITQARMTSTRLPGKILMTIKGKTLLEYHVERLRWSGLPVIVATTTNETDQPVVDLCNRLNIPCFRGDENDVLARFYGAAKQEGLSVIVRATSDCPLIDGKFIQEALKEFDGYDYLANGLGPICPLGFSFEIMTFEALQQAHQQAVLPFEREHVTPYIYHSHAGQFRIRPYAMAIRDTFVRATVDEPDDFAFVAELIEKFGCDKKSLEQILEVVIANPYVNEINNRVQQRNII